MQVAPYLSAFGILTVIHGFRVIRLRRIHKVPLGDGGVPELIRLCRVFGNHAEYVPIGLVLLLALELVEAPNLYLHICGGTLLLGRCLHAMALEKSSTSSPGRTAGMAFTFLSLILLSVGLLFFSVHISPHLAPN